MKKLRPLIFAAGGALAGLAYFEFFGCRTGCPIASSPYLTMGYMGVAGWLLSFVFEKKPQEGS